MKKLTVVHFGPNGPRIHVGPAAAKLAGDPRSLCNPKIPRGIPPHQWIQLEASIGVSKVIPRERSLLANVPAKASPSSPIMGLSIYYNNNTLVSLSLASFILGVLLGLAL